MESLSTLPADRVSRLDMAITVSATATKKPTPTIIMIRLENIPFS
jgi:hypothetical protein